MIAGPNSGPEGFTVCNAAPMLAEEIRVNRRAFSSSI